jgi:hypothetical protein
MGEQAERATQRMRDLGVVAVHGWTIPEASYKRSCQLHLRRGKKGLTRRTSKERTESDPIGALTRAGVRRRIRGMCIRSVRRCDSIDVRGNGAPCVRGGTLYRTGFPPRDHRLVDGNVGELRQFHRTLALGV